MAQLEPAKLPLTIYQGVDFWEALRLGSSLAGTYLNTTGYTARLTAVPDGDWTADPVVLLTTANGGISVGVDGLTLAETTLGAGAAKGATSVTVASATGISIGDRIDIALADGANIATTTVADLSGTTVTLQSALPGAADSGAAVYVTDVTTAGMYNVLLYMSGAATADLVPWGHGAYVLDLTDTAGREQRVAQHTIVLQEGDTA